MRDTARPARFPERVRGLQPHDRHGVARAGRSVLLYHKNHARPKRQSASFGVVVLFHRARVKKCAVAADPVITLLVPDGVHLHGYVARLEVKNMVLRECALFAHWNFEKARRRALFCAAPIAGGLLSRSDSGCGPCNNNPCGR